MFKISMLRHLIFQILIEEIKEESPATFCSFRGQNLNFFIKDATGRKQIVNEC